MDRGLLAAGCLAGAAAVAAVCVGAQGRGTRAAGAAHARVAPGDGIGPGLIGSRYHLGDPNNAIVAVRTRRPLVALTFDDGPSRRWTPGVLAALRANHAHATFFLVGLAAARSPRLVRAELAAGHEVADHTWSHPRLPPLSDGGLRREISRGAAILTMIVGRRPRLFRPPHGDFDARVSAAVTAAGLRMIGWELAVERKVDGRSPAAAARALAAEVRPGSIVLAHDGRLPRGRTLAVIRLLLPVLRRRGLHLVTVSTLLRATEPQPIASTSPLSLPTSSVPSPASAG